MIATAAKELLKFAVGRAINCQSCGAVLDAPRAVEFRAAGHECIRCADCFDLVIASIPTKVLDGRLLFAPRPKLPTVHNPVTQYEVSPGRRYITNQGMTVTVLRRPLVRVGRMSRTHFICRNEATGREVTIKSAARFARALAADE